MEWFPFSAAVLLLLLSYLLLLCESADRLTAGADLSGNQTLVSGGGTFVLGFFSLSNSSAAANWYAGIWYNKVTERRCVWVANRENPLRHSPGIMRISNDSSLVITDSDGNLIWSSNSSTAVSTSSSSSSSLRNGTSAVLLDSGNLMLMAQGDSSSTILWQSFDYPTATFLPGMMLWSNYRTKTSQKIVSWRDRQDPSPGNFSFCIDDTTPFQFIMRNGSEPFWRSSVWNGNTFSGLPVANSNYVIYLTYAADEQWTNVSLSVSQGYGVADFMLNYAGILQQLQWMQGPKEWSVVAALPSPNLCDIYGLCGPFGFCDSAVSPATCKCLEGFAPKNLKAWAGGDFREGCARTETLGCDGSHEFVRFDQMKLPDNSVFSNVNMSQCIESCLRNCSCLAYAYSDLINEVRLVHRCLTWTGGLVDMGHVLSGGEALYVRISASNQGRRRINTRAIIIAVSCSLAVFFVVLLYLIFKCKKSKDFRRKETIIFGGTRKDWKQFDPSSSEELGIQVKQEASDLPYFKFEVLMASTNNFSDLNKIGQGGFGKVYKGKLADGQDIAIKRLSRDSGQGLQEFKNEVILISKLQHRNLVRLMGCCIQGEEKILVYEYMPNESLDYFLFNAEKKQLLDWVKRFSIIKGIARGLLYLHQDSRVRIIHRDLKAGNILLDEEMNPKISDFGLARICGADQIQANTNRVWLYVSRICNGRAFLSEK